MNEDALFAIGSVLAALGDLLEREGVCTTHELAETLGSVAVITQEGGEEYSNRAAYIAGWAHMVRAGPALAGKSSQH